MYSIISILFPVHGQELLPSIMRGKEGQTCMLLDSGEKHPELCEHPEGITLCFIQTFIEHQVLPDQTLNYWRPCAPTQVFSPILCDYCSSAWRLKLDAAVQGIASGHRSPCAKKSSNGVSYSRHNRCEETKQSVRKHPVQRMVLIRQMWKHLSRCTEAMWGL